MEYFDRIWEAAPQRPLVPELYAERLEFLLQNVTSGQRVLDVGCGDGAFTHELAKHGAHVFGVDVSAVALQRARARDPQLELVCADATELSFEDGSFDLIWAGEVLEHVQDVVGLAWELRRVLAPAGRLIVSTPDHPLLLRLRLALVPGAFATHLDPRSDHVRFFTAASLRTLLTDAGFASITVTRRAGHLLATAS